MPAPKSRRWMTAIKRERAANRKRVLEYQLSPWEIQALMRARRQVHPDSMVRAMGKNIPPPHFNPGGEMRRRRRRNPEQLALKEIPGGGGKKKGKGRRKSPKGLPRGGSVAASSAAPAKRKGGKKRKPLVTPGQVQGFGWIDAPRGVKISRKRATRATDLKTKKKIWVDEFGQKITRDRWKYYHRGGLDVHGRRAGGGGKRRKGKMPPALAAYWAKRRGKGAAARKGGKRRRMPSKKQLRKIARRFPWKTQIAWYPGVPRGKRIPKGAKRRTVTNPRGGGREMRRNPRRRRRNPSMNIMATAKRTISAAVPAVAGGALVSLIDAKLLGGRPLALRVAGKLVAAAAAGAFLRSRPDTARILQGAMLGSLGYELGARMAGGIVAANPADAAQQASGMGYLVRADGGGGSLSALVDASGQTNSMPSLHGLGAPVFDPNIG